MCHEKGEGIFQHFYVLTCIIKNILEYAQMARNGTESKIPYIESHSTI